MHVRFAPTHTARAGRLRILHWHSLHGSARALALAEAVRADTRPWVCVAADARELERLAAELRFFGGAALEILTLPDWEVLPYDLFSPHPDIVSRAAARRSRACRTLTRGILLLTADSLLATAAAVDYVSARSFELERGAALPIEPLRRRLVESGYASVSQVSGPGEFALRGSLFDVFPMGTETPVRVDLLDDRIDSLRRFDPDTQRSLERIEQLAAAAGARAAARCRGGARVPSPLPAALRRRCRAHERSIAASARASRRRASSSTCRCSSSTPRR